MISGEYLVMKGAQSLALPVKFGQDLRVQSNDKNDLLLYWQAGVQGKNWFDAVFDLANLEIIETNDIQKARFLKSLLHEANRLNPKTLKNSKGLKILTHANFNIEWGLGSSSTLIANMAKWFKIDPFVLHFKISKGSGYDIACANARTPIFYTLKDQRPNVEPADFNPDFSDQIFFVYLGQKQRSDKSIENLKHRLEKRENEIQRVSEISEELCATHDLDEFEFFINELEAMMSQALGMPTAKESRFTDFPGSVKSLGAWGGDFVMVTWRDGLENLKSWLRPKGLDIVFTFADLILKDTSGN